MVVSRATPDHPDVARPESRLVSHSIKFRDRPLCIRNHGADMLGIGLAEEAGRDYLVTLAMLANRMRLHIQVSGFIEQSYEVPTV